MLCLDEQAKMSIELEGNRDSEFSFRDSEIGGTFGGGASSRKNNMTKNTTPKIQRSKNIKYDTEHQNLIISLFVIVHY